MKCFATFVALCSATLLHAALAGSDQCGYQSCPEIKEDKLNVHIVCHTHDDVGWVRTVDEYYDGKYIVTVKEILDSVVRELPRHRDRKFIYVETAFFWRWWNEQTSAVKDKVHELVRSGQLEFVGGGWVMNDEGTVHYSDTIDHMTLGLRRLRGLFGECGVPKVIWQIDPFGHSREQASLFRQMGFDGLFLGRIHYQDKKARLKSKTMEFVWNTSASLGSQAELFTGILYDEYSAPNGFCFDFVCGYSVDEANVHIKANDFLDIIKKQSKSYATNNIMVTMGGDFTYVKAEKWFNSLDILMKYINKMEGSKVNMIYSSPSCYLHALHKSNLTWTTKSDDFFPYANNENTYWTGYFTSRPSFKKLVRKASNILQVCRQLQFLTQEYAGAEINKYDLLDLKEALGVAQHHDAVSGTAKQYVTEDYMIQLVNGIKTCEEVISDAYQSILSPLQEGNSPIEYIFCEALNVSHCQFTETKEQFTVAVYNPLARSVDYIVRLPVTDGSFEVTDANKQILENQVSPLSENLMSIPERTNSRATHSLMFRTRLPPLGFRTFDIKKTSEKNKGLFDERVQYINDDNAENDNDENTDDDDDNEEVILSNKLLTLRFNKRHGTLQDITDETNNISVEITQNFFYYPNRIDGIYQSSGAYIFRPSGDAIPISSSSTPLRIVKGPIFDEVHQIFHSKVSQVVRLPKHEKYVEFEWLIGPISVKDRVSKEVISLFQTNLNTNEIFYTDANGREILKRTLDRNPTFNLTVTQPIAGNYYPVNSRMFIRDEEKDVQVTLLTDRSVGGSSLSDGAMELMLHRRTVFDDGKGVEEPLNEPGYDGKGLIALGRTYLLIDRIEESTRRHREMSQNIYLEPHLAFMEKLEKGIDEFSGLREALPPNVHILTLEVLREPYVLLRLENIYEVNEDKKWSRTATVDLRVIFKNSTILDVREATLGANQRLDKNVQLLWSVENAFDGEDNGLGNEHEYNSVNHRSISLAPMQIRTFFIKLATREDKK